MSDWIFNALCFIGVIFVLSWFIHYYGPAKFSITIGQKKPPKVFNAPVSGTYEFKDGTFKLITPSKENNKGLGVLLEIDLAILRAKNKKLVEALMEIGCGPGYSSETP